MVLGVIVLVDVWSINERLLSNSLVVGFDEPASPVPLPLAFPAFERDHLFPCGSLEVHPSPGLVKCFACGISALCVWALDAARLLGRPIGHIIGGPAPGPAQQLAAAFLQVLLEAHESPEESETA